MIRRIHWTNAVLDLDNVLQDMRDHNTHNPKHRMSVEPATIYKAFKTLQCVRVVEFGPLAKNIGTPTPDQIVRHYVGEFRRHRLEPERLMETNSLNSVLWLITHLRHELEISRSEARHSDYNKQYDLTVEYQ